MQPERRPVENLDRERRKDHDESGDEHHKECRSVGGVGKGIVEPASLAARGKRQVSVEQAALAAARAAAAKPAHDWDLPRRVVNIRHRAARASAPWAADPIYDPAAQCPPAGAASPAPEPQT